MQAHRLLVAAILVGGCTSPASPAPEPPPMPSLDLPGTVHTQVVGAGAIAEQALQPSALQGLLDRAGFESGRERTWADRTAAVRLVSVRAVRFASEAGAERFQTWLGGHGAELIGGGTAADPIGPMAALVRHHEPDACCPTKDTTWLLAAWREGSTVWIVTIGGPGADRAALSGVLEDVAA